MPHKDKKERKSSKESNNFEVIDRSERRRLIKQFLKEVLDEVDTKNLKSKKIEGLIYDAAVEKFDISEFKSERNFEMAYNWFFIEKMVGISPKFHRFYGKYKIDEIVKDPVLTRRMERSMYNGVRETAKKKEVCLSWEDSEFTSMYWTKIRSFVANINPDSYIKNTEFLKRIKLGDYDIKTLGSIPETQWFPERIPKLVNDSIRGRVDPGSICTHFKCGKCKESKTTYYELQLRSCDEPQTVFITCLVCDNRWKMG